MKKLTILFALIAVNIYGLKAQIAWPQNGTSIYYNGGNVGIGTNSPSSKLLIIDASNYQTSTGLSLGSLTIANNYAGLGSNIALFENQNTAADNQLAVFTPAQYVSGIQAQRYINGAASSLSLNPLGGNVGIGTTTPLTKLNVSIAQGPAGGTAPKGFSISDLSTTGGLLDIGIEANGNFYSWLQSRHFNSANYFNLVLNPAGGNVGIGTANPQNKLDVAGTIRCTEVKVVALPWADFVFHPTYQLRSLGEVEQFIKTNSHLPEIPTEAEVKENGVGLGEMNAKLLQKVEELTLYMIEMQKKMEDQQKQINAMMGLNPSGNTPATK